MAFEIPEIFRNGIAGQLMGGGKGGSKQPPPMRPPTSPMSGAAGPGLTGSWASGGAPGGGGSQPQPGSAVPQATGSFFGPQSTDQRLALMRAMAGRARGRPAMPGGTGMPSGGPPGY